MTSISWTTCKDTPNNRCPICLSDFKTSDTIVKHTELTTQRFVHPIHRECLKNLWDYGNNQCPCCRTKVLQEISEIFTTYEKIQRGLKKVLEQSILGGVAGAAFSGIAFSTFFLGHTITYLHNGTLKTIVDGTMLFVGGIITVLLLPPNHSPINSAFLLKVGILTIQIIWAVFLCICYHLCLKDITDSITFFKREKMTDMTQKIGEICGVIIAFVSIIVAKNPSFRKIVTISMVANSVIAGIHTTLRL